MGPAADHLGTLEGQDLLARLCEQRAHPETGNAGSDDDHVVFIHAAASILRAPTICSSDVVGDISTGFDPDQARVYLID
jgi:hypothetical protein